MMRRVLGLVLALLGVFGLSGCTGDEVVGGSSVSVSSSTDEGATPSATPTGDPNLVATDPNVLVVGQCIHDVVFLTAPVTTVDAISCALAHDGEVVAVTHEGNVRDTEFAKSFCTQAFTSYIGIDFNASELQLMYIKPGAEVVNGQLACLAYDVRSEWTTSMQGAAQ
jgi:hypothetical protein